MNANIYTRLGVKTLINAQGTVTVVGGSLMPPEVVQAMAEAADWFVSIPELQEKVGARIAGLMGVPAAMVTAGAASSITVATAACMTWDQPAGDGSPTRYRRPEKRGRHPERPPQPLRATNPPDRSQARVGRDPCGAGSGDQPRTAMMFFLNRSEPLGKIKRQEWIRVGKERGVPLFNDAAADVPPAGSVFRISSPRIRSGRVLRRQGFARSAGLGIVAGPPRSDRGGPAGDQPGMGIGRGDEGWQGRDRRPAGGRRTVPQARPRRGMADRGRPAFPRCIVQLAEIPGMNARREVAEIANHSPQVVLEWSEWHSKLTAEEVVRMLWEGDPRIAVLGEGERRLTDHGLDLARR